LGADGLPFMNSTTLCLFMSSLQRAVISSSVRGREGSAGAGVCGCAVDEDWGAEGAEAEAEAAEGEPECCERSERRSAGSAPLCRPRSV
jgi:hypothetical protein